MRPFIYDRPASLDVAISLLSQGDQGESRVLAGGTDLIIRLRDGTYRPTRVVDIKHIPELVSGITETAGVLRISAGTSMTDVLTHQRVRSTFPALAEAAGFVGSVQIRNRATLVGNMCNASPAADTAPPLLIYDAWLEIAGPDGTRRLKLDDFFVSSGITALRRGELVTAIELPLPDEQIGSAFQRRTRRRGHDLASVTLAIAVRRGGQLRLAYGSLGPRPLVFEGEPDQLEAWFASAAPSPTSMRAAPDYRLAMLSVLAGRALVTARERLSAA